MSRESLLVSKLVVRMLIEYERAGGVLRIQSLICAFRPEPREVAQAERENEDGLRDIHTLSRTDSGRYPLRPNWKMQRWPYEYAEP